MSRDQQQTLPEPIASRHYVATSGVTHDVTPNRPSTRWVGDMELVKAASPPKPTETQRQRASSFVFALKKNVLDAPALEGLRATLRESYEDKTHDGSISPEASAKLRELYNYIEWTVRDFAEVATMGLGT